MNHYQSKTSSITSLDITTLPHREPLFDCLKDVDLIPPFNRMLLEVTFGKLYSWAIHNVRNILLEASARFKELGEWRGYALSQITNLATV